MAGMNWCICKKRHKEGYTRYKDKWVCPRCRMYDKMAITNLVTDFHAPNTPDLHLFVGGPWHNEIWTSDALINAREDGETAPWIVEYTKAGRSIPGAKTGRLASVWVWTDDILEEDRE